MRLADVDHTSAEMSALAAAICRVALRSAVESVPHPGAAEALVCIGMGKFGGWELNLGSDIDLCFFYAEPDDDDDYALYTGLSRAITQSVRMLSDVTGDGFCFRVDLRLRPEGSRGTLLRSIASAERYYETWGRLWERAAWLRARPVAGHIGLGNQLIDALRPFVLRRAVDPSIAEEMTGLLERTRQQHQVDLERDVKLGRGGIREAEFFVQSLQLIWGGQYPRLHVPGTIKALRRLESLGLVSEGEARALGAAWARLRRIEHRIHVWSGYQTHLLPAEGEELERFARSLGYLDGDALHQGLSRDRDRVATLFESLRPARPAKTRDPRFVALCEEIASGPSAEQLASAITDVLPVFEPDEAAHHLLRLARRPDAPLGPLMRERHPDVGPRLLEEVSKVADPDACLRGLASFFGRVWNWSVEHFFSHDPRLLRRLVGVLGTSPTLSDALIGHPEDVDLLLASDAIEPRGIRALNAQVEELSAGDDAEALVRAMRAATGATQLRVGLAWLAGEQALPECLRALSLAADIQIRAALAFATRLATERFGPPSPVDTNTEGALPASLAVVALGKLGGSELGFGGDLDLLFIYDGDGETLDPTSPITHAEFFTRIAQQTTRILTQPHAGGPAYHTDIRLRPSGAQGTLVVSLDGFDRYHAVLAAPWERQVLVRARAVAGHPALQQKIMERVRAIAYSSPALRRDLVAEMRGRMQLELAKESPTRYHPKLGFGGLVDIEFLCQCLQMEHGVQVEDLRVQNTPSALRALVKHGVLPPTDAEVLLETYAFLRGVEQTLALLGTEPVMRIEQRSTLQVARRLRIRERDGHEPAQVLASSYRRAATKVREIFERWIGVVPVPAPWIEARSS